MSTIFTTLAVAFGLSVVAGIGIIPVLRRMKFGQSIREEGPKSHQKKAGTPTMGGLIFILSIVLTTIIIGSITGLLTSSVIALLIVFSGFGLIGFVDDYIIVVMKRNLGLTSLQKLLAQIVVAIGAYFLLKQSSLETTVVFPFTDWSIDLGVFYIAFIIFWLVGFSNAVNITDGLDGLATGTSIIAFTAYGLIASVRGQEDIWFFAFTVVGALAGFLLYNKKPAKTFMGDTGSLALGGTIALLAILTKQELMLLLIGLIFVAETLSVILQVASFKLTGKRIFKMSPLHHHFELSGWSEWKIVLVFWSIGLLAAIAPIVYAYSGGM